eukprot:487629-Amphidinium_carterae.1
MTISYHYADDYCSRMKFQGLKKLKQQGFGEREIKRKETLLHNEQILELYIILPHGTLKQWMTTGTIPPSYMDNGTDEKHRFCECDSSSLAIVPSIHRRVCSDRGPMST